MPESAFSVYLLKLNQIGEPILIVCLLQHEYIYKFPNGSQVVRDSEDPALAKSLGSDYTVRLGTSTTPATTTTTTVADVDYDSPGK